MHTDDRNKGRGDEEDVNFHFPPSLLPDEINSPMISSVLFAETIMRLAGWGVIEQRVSAPGLLCVGIFAKTIMYNSSGQETVSFLCKELLVNSLGCADHMWSLSQLCHRSIKTQTICQQVDLAVFQQNFICGP